MSDFPTLEDYVGQTPLVRLQRLNTGSATVLVKLEGNNPAGSVKDRPALNMIVQAEARGTLQPGDTIIEATSGNTGIALAMAAAIKGYKMILIMPDNATQERKDSMRAYGAELILVSKEQGMEGARDLALQMQQEGKGKVLINSITWITLTHIFAPLAQKSGSKAKAKSLILFPAWAPQAP